MIPDLSYLSSIVTSIKFSPSQVIELTVRNWDEVYEDLSKRLKVKPQGGAVMSKHLKMAGQPSSPWLLSLLHCVAGMLSKMESAIKEGQGEKAKDIYQVPHNVNTRNIEQSPNLRFNVYPPWLFRGTSRGRRRQKRRCRRMFSQSGARTADTDTFFSSCLTNMWWYRFLKKQPLFQNFHGLRLENGGARKRTSQEEGDLQVRKIRKEICNNIAWTRKYALNVWMLNFVSKVRGAMDSVQYELVSAAGQEVPVGTRLICRGVQQQGPGCQVALD